MIPTSKQHWYCFIKVSHCARYIFIHSITLAEVMCLPSNAYQFLSYQIHSTGDLVGIMTDIGPGMTRARENNGAQPSMLKARQKSSQSRQAPRWPSWSVFQQATAAKKHRMSHGCKILSSRLCGRYSCNALVSHRVSLVAKPLSSWDQKQRSW